MTRAFNIVFATDLEERVFGQWLVAEHERVVEAGAPRRRHTVVRQLDVGAVIAVELEPRLVHRLLVIAVVFLLGARTR